MKKQMTKEEFVESAVIKKAIREFLSREEQEEMERYNDFNYDDYRTKLIKFVEDTHQNSIYKVNFSKYDYLKIRDFTSRYLVNEFN
jgi:hypothetical protein